MATQTGSIDLRGANSAKLYVDDEAGEIRSEVSETYATKTEVRRTDTGSGTVVTSDDAASLPPLSLTVHGKSVQDGTPTPSAPVLIQSVEGRNLLPSNYVSGSQTYQGLTWTINGDGTLTCSGTATASGYYVLYGGFTNAAPVPSWMVEGRIYGFGDGYTDISSDHGMMMVYFYKGTGALLTANQRTSNNFTVPSGATSFGVFIRFENGKALNTTFYPRITARTYSMYTPYGSIGIGTERSLVDFSPGATVTSGAKVVDDNGTVTVSAAIARGWSYAYWSTVAEEGAKYILSATASGTSPRIMLAFNDEPNAYSFIRTLQLDGAGDRSVTTVSPSGANYVQAFLYARNSSSGAASDASSYEYPRLVKDGMLPYIPLQGHALRSLPDGTEDTLEVDGEGNVTLTQRIGSTTTATTDGITATVGTDAMSTTGTLADGATVIYKLASEQTISLGKIDLPSLPSPSFSMHVDALVTPTLDAEWWTQGGEEVGSVYQRTSALEQDVDGITLELSEKVDSSEEWVSWLHAGTDATTHEPYLAMGKDSDYPSVVYGSDAARFYDGEGDAASNVVASFGTEGVVVGKDGSANTTISDSEIVFHDADGNEAGKISMSSAGAVPTSATYTLTTSGTATASDSITGITPLPDFTLGYLVLRDKVSSGGGGIFRIESWSDVASPVTMSTSTIDYTFKATPSGDTWGIEITATNRSGTTASQTVEYALEWYYRGSAPQYKFGTGENAGAYSFLAGVGLKTAKPAQIVLGSYNEPSQTDLFMLGSGTSDSNRSNALRADEHNVLHIISFSQYGGGVELTQSALWGWQQALFGYSDSEDWTYLAGSASGNFCRWKVKSGWVQVEIHYASGAGLSANTAKNYGTITGIFRPDHEVNNALYLGANKNGQADMWVTKAGAVWVNSTIASSTIYGQLQYPL